MTKERRKKNNIKYTKEDFEKAIELECPNKRAIGSYWITLFKEPCIKENCSWDTCNKHGTTIKEQRKKPTQKHELSRLIIVKGESNE